MPRTIEFNLDETLGKAMTVFWKHGYEKTSIQDLVSATGVNRYGLYSEFGDKHELFLACLDHYQSTIVTTAFNPVERENAGLKEIHRYFKLVLSTPEKKANNGCLMTNTAVDIAPSDKQAAKKVEAHRQRLKTGFKQAILNAQQSGEISKTLDAEVTADFLIGTVHGVSVMLRSKADRQMIYHYVKTALSLLR